MPNNILHKKGDAIEGEKITVECRNYHFQKNPIKGSSRDKKRRGSLEGTVYCVIDKPIKSLRKNIQPIE